MDSAWAQTLHAVLTEADYQTLFLDFHPRDGIQAGQAWEQALYRQLRRCRGVVALCTEAWLASPWCVAEVILAREKGKPVFLLARAPVPGFLTHLQHIDLGGMPDAAGYERLLSGLDAAGLSDAFPLPERPYPGLAAFGEADAAVFFGREAEIEKVINTLNQRLLHNAEGLLVVLGASGCGKSSLVRAGVLPRLRRPGKEAGTPGRWIIPPPFMGGTGLDGLATALSLAFAESGRSMGWDAVRNRIDLAADGAIEPAARGLQALSHELRVAHALAEAQVLVVVDQLEEVFAPTASPEARALLALLLAASGPTGSPIVVLATLRSDFLNPFQLFPGASESYHGITLDPMPSARFGEVIEGPAERFGLRLEPGLTERLVHDTRHDDALPLLAFTLEQLHRQCAASGELTVAAYDTLFPPVEVREADGRRREYRGVSAAIKHVADQILEATGYRDLPSESPRLRDLRRALYRLAQVGKGGQFTRRSARRRDMPASCQDILQRLVKQRLLVASSEDGEETLSVAHEALFRVWDTLRAWLEQDREALHLRGQIETAAREWDTAGWLESRRWPDERIMDAVGAIAPSGVALDDVAEPDQVGAFLGPTERDVLEALPFCTAAAANPYGEAWRLPLSHAARATAGARLALLGDPRFGDGREGTGLRPGGLPDIVWCPVDAGEVTIEIRANPLDPNSPVADTLTRAVDPFWIARYPVTLVQFQAFVAACHVDGRWRSTFLAEQADYPRPEPRARYANHPMDTVNWYDAMAFCQWLSEALGYEIRLPTEIEWQLAATGGDAGRAYPWGGEWDTKGEPWRANTYESGLGAATAVGLYPHGASPVGALDMAGTVWEWCLNAFEDPDDVDFPRSTDERRVLRGGSWYDDLDDVRAPVRYDDGPDIRLNDGGFRVVCVSPISWLSDH